MTYHAIAVGLMTARAGLALFEIGLIQQESVARSVVDTHAPKPMRADAHDRVTESFFPWHASVMGAKKKFSEFGL